MEYCIAVTPVGTETPVRLEQFLKAYDPMERRLAGSGALESFVQPLNALSHMAVTPLGMATLVNLSHPENAEL